MRPRGSAKPRLTAVNPAVRVNAEGLAALQPQLERFFDPSSGDWRPRAGVLTFDHGGPDAGAHVGEIPGEAVQPPS